jgi:uncharacterized protein (DUF1501 family)
MIEPILVVVFLRGGADGLSLVSPVGDKNYVAARAARLRVTRNGDNAGHQLASPLADVDFRFHRQAKELAELYKTGDLAVVHAAGLKDATRSHFDAEDRMERANAGTGVLAGGWLGRWLNATKPQGILPAFAVGSSAPDSLRGFMRVAVADQISSLRVAPGNGISGALRAHLLRKLGDDAVLGAPVRNILNLSKEIEARVALDADGNLKPYQAASDYPEDNPLAGQLKSVAQVIKLDLGLRVATLDFGGWDTHVDQSGQFAALTSHLASGLMAFWKDLGKLQESVSVIVMSEFGRRLKSNESGGTDHGHGNVMMMLGANVTGGRMYGRWPGLENDALDEGADLAITTDYRTVLSEMVSSHLRSADVGSIFPGFSGGGLSYLR